MEAHIINARVECLKLAFANTHRQGSTDENVALALSHKLCQYVFENTLSGISTDNAPKAPARKK